MFYFVVYLIKFLGGNRTFAVGTVTADEGPAVVLEYHYAVRGLIVHVIADIIVVHGGHNIGCVALGRL